MYTIIIFLLRLRKKFNKLFRSNAQICVMYCNLKSFMFGEYFQDPKKTLLWLPKTFIISMQNLKMEVYFNTNNIYYENLYSCNAYFVNLDKKTAKSKRKSVRVNDIADIQIKKEFGCDNCDRSFNSLAVIAFMLYVIKMLELFE